MNIKINFDQNQIATKSDLIELKNELKSDINVMQDDINTMKDDIAKVLVFLYDHFPIQQHQVRENTDRIENHEVRIVRVEDVLDISAIN